MFDEYSREQAIRKLQMVRYLLTTADERGLSHGEKHYLIQTSLILLLQIARHMIPDFSWMERNEKTNIEKGEVPKTDASDIPF